MSEHPTSFRFSDKSEEPPLDFISHHLIGGNPNDLETGSWFTEEEALTAFAVQFAELAQQEAKHNFLFVRTPPALVKDFSNDKVKYKMVGRFILAKPKEMEK